MNNLPVKLRRTSAALLTVHNSCLLFDHLQHVLSLHSSHEPGELAQWLWSWWQHHKHYGGIIIIIIIISDLAIFVLKRDVKLQPTYCYYYSWKCGM